MTTRRDLLTLLGGAAAAWPCGALAQQAGSVRRIGFFSGGVVAGRGTTSGPVIKKGLPPFFDELRKHGFSQGNNLVMDFRSTNVSPSQVIADMADLMQARTDVIVTT